MEASQLAPLSSLEVLDLTRNNIATLADGTFEALANLKELRLGVNMIRQVSCLSVCCIILHMTTIQNTVQRLHH